MIVSYERIIPCFIRILFCSLTAVSLSSRWFTCDCFRETILTFFEKQNALLSAKVATDDNLLPVSPAMLDYKKAVLLKIVRHCDSLRELIFEKKPTSRYSLRDMSWIELLDPTELSELYAKLSKLDQVTLAAVIKRSSLSLTLSWTNGMSITDTHLRGILKHLSIIEHLTLTDRVSDGMLQTIFQFMVSCLFVAIIEIFTFPPHFFIINP